MGELVEQEAQWKVAYETLLQENNTLKNSGAEALLASQWRARYELCKKEKEDMINQIDMLKKQLAESKANMNGNGGSAEKYEMKYRDLKESFRLYRKKAKEIFEAQLKGENNPARVVNLSERGTEDAKIAYLRNLMVNYLSSGETVREHMESAIGTILKFSAEDVAKVEKAKEENLTWF